MPHYIAFLRGINLGNRRLKMGTLRGLFEEMKFADVATFIASGNVSFASKTTDATKLEKQIQAHLAKSLGCEVDTFVRTRAEVAAVAAARPFARGDLEHPANRLYVGFLGAPPSAVLARDFEACGTEADELRMVGREFYWLCRVKSSDSTVWTSPQMRALKLPSSSMRNMTTIRKLAQLYPAPES